MSQTINVNGQSISYPETGDTNWGDEATSFAVQTSAALGKIGLASGTSVDIAQTLDVTGATTLDSTLTVAGTTTLNGIATLNGNTNLGNAITDTVTVTAILNVDSGVLYVDPSTNKVGINDTTPSEALDVTGNALISGTLGVTGNETIGGTLGVTGNLAVNTNKFNVTASSGDTLIAGNIGVTGDVAINTNKFNITASSGDTTIAGTLNTTGLISSATGILTPTAIFEDKQTAGTAAQTLTTGAWRTRRLNVSTYNNITGASLSSNQITLLAGNYLFYGYAKIGDNTSNQPVRSQLRLYNITDASVIQSGTNGYNNAGANAMSTLDTIIGYFSIAASKVLELQHQVQQTCIGGASINATFTVSHEIYASIQLVKVG